MNNDATAKIRMLQDSVQCLVFGLLGFLPVIGIPFAVAALWIGGRVRVRERKYWNAAKPYRIWGVVCAAIALVNVLVSTVIIAVNSIEPGFWYSAN